MLTTIVHWLPESRSCLPYNPANVLGCHISSSHPHPYKKKGKENQFPPANFSFYFYPHHYYTLVSHRTFSLSLSFFIISAFWDGCSPILFFCVYSRINPYFVYPTFHPFAFGVFLGGLTYFPNYSGWRSFPILWVCFLSLYFLHSSCLSLLLHFVLFR